jgi:hypothetical protein
MPRVPRKRDGESVSENPLTALPSEMPYGNDNLDRALFGLTRQIVHQSSRYGWSPRRMRFRTHLDGKGVLTFRYDRVRGETARWFETGHTTEIHEWMRARNRPIVDFFRLCPSYRTALVSSYEKAVSFANAHGIFLRDVHVGTGRVPRNAPAWLRLYPTREASILDMRPMK